MCRYYVVSKKVYAPTFPTFPTLQLMRNSSPFTTRLGRISKVRASYALSP